METVQEQLGQPASAALAAQPNVDPSKAVWRVLLSGGGFPFAVMSAACIGGDTR
ncbi:MAG TPA: hypothetical protein VKU87_04540 [Thermomicrobiaceae bacterium]|nr:hypothetical protein [Thermomicrobiaceae bacterium]